MVYPYVLQWFSRMHSVMRWRTTILAHSERSRALVIVLCTVPYACMPMYCNASHETRCKTV
jgi:hypothetical protein